MWELYDKIIEPIPDDVKVDEILTGVRLTYVSAGGCEGICPTHELQTRGRIAGREEYVNGLSWRRAASLIKSWNFTEASIGAAAVNAFYNQRDKVDKACEQRNDIVRLNAGDVFLTDTDRIEGKNVAVIGHFRHLERWGEKAENLYILEREPMEGDYPDSACEYILPSVDYVFITGFTLVNKTLPRLLQLSEKAKVIMVGPSVPLAFSLMDFGVSELAGTYPFPMNGIRQIITTGENRPMLHRGEQVRIGCCTGVEN